MKAETPCRGCGVRAISKWSPVVLEMRKKEKSLGVLKRAAVPRPSRTSSYNSSWHTMKTPFKAPITDFPLSPKHLYAAPPILHILFFFLGGSLFFFRKNGTRRIDQRQGYRRSTFHPSSPREKWGAVRIQQSQGRRSWMKPTASGLRGSVNEAERQPEFRKKEAKKPAGKWCKRQKKECVGDTAGGPRSGVCFILSQHRQSRKTFISPPTFDPNITPVCFKCLRWVTTAADFYRWMKLYYHLSRF